MCDKEYDVKVRCDLSQSSQIQDVVDPATQRQLLLIYYFIWSQILENFHGCLYKAELTGNSCILFIIGLQIAHPPPQAINRLLNLPGVSQDMPLPQAMGMRIATSFQKKSVLLLQSVGEYRQSISGTIKAGFKKYYNSPILGAIIFGLNHHGT